MRSFVDKPATREKVPVLCALFGPSGGGKTYSALRLATGIQRVAGGDIFVIDTESRRSLHYADKFKFRHVHFAAPFGPLDYLAAIEHCVSQGARTVVVDSLSHEHEGPGGVLESHDEELKRMGGQMSKTMLAWAKPKAQRRRLINTILQLDVNLVTCFRAKQKLKMVRGKEPEPLGWMAIGGEEYLFEMSMGALLLPNANGVPEWNPSLPGEQQMVKLPGQFEEILPGQQLSEDIGEAMARWAAGTPAKPEVYRFPRGEFEGKTIADVSDEYLDTLSRNDKVKGDLRKLVEAEMSRRLGEGEPPAE